MTSMRHSSKPKNMKVESKNLVPTSFQYKSGVRLFCFIIYQFIIKNTKLLMFFNQPATQNIATPNYIFYIPSHFNYYGVQNSYFGMLPSSFLIQNQPNQPFGWALKNETVAEFNQKNEQQRFIEQLQEKNNAAKKYNKPAKERLSRPLKFTKIIKPAEIRLDYRIQWTNQNRNIIPNIVNQMVSYLLKKNKSLKLLRKIFDHHKHEDQWTEKRFYTYIKKIKQSITHYVNENTIRLFLQIHQPKCQLYQYEEQHFYMKICRILILTFLRNDAILVPLTSNRMSSEKRKIHLIAREALLRKFLQISHNSKK